mgnify:CR=1 FL=1
MTREVRFEAAVETVFIEEGFDPAFFIALPDPANAEVAATCLADGGKRAFGIAPFAALGHGLAEFGPAELGDPADEIAQHRHHAEHQKRDAEILGRKQARDHHRAEHLRGKTKPHICRRCPDPLLEMCHRTVPLSASDAGLAGGGTPHRGCHQERGGKPARERKSQTHAPDRQKTLKRCS